MDQSKPYVVERYPDEPILLVETHEGYIARTHLEDILAESRLILDASPEPMFVINSIDAVPASIDDAIYVSNTAARGEDPIWKHPNIREMIWVTTNRMAKLAIKGLDSAAFGHLKHKAVDTLEEALTYIRG